MSWGTVFLLFVTIMDLTSGWRRTNTHTHAPRTAHIAQAETRRSPWSLFVVSVAMQRMKKAELVAEMAKFGEEPPAGWGCVELRQRLADLYEQHPTMNPNRKKKTDLRQKVIALNVNSKKKANLQMWCRDTLGMVITGNETIQQLQRGAMVRIYQETQPDPQDPVGFGKAAALTYEEVAEDVEYCSWVKKMAAEGEVCVQMARLASWLNSLDNPTPADAVMEPPKPKVKEPNLSVTIPEKKKSTYSAKSSNSSGSMDTETLKMLKQLTETVQDLKEEVQDMRQENPRRKKKDNSESSFKMVNHE